MKHYSFSFYLLTLVFLLSACAQRGAWKLVWEDEFRGNTFDERTWSKIPRGTSDWNNYMSDLDTLFAVERGNLILRGIENAGVVPNDTAPFLTGGLYTRGKRSFEEGRVEIRAKFEDARGAWPAFWMLPFTNERGSWPDGGEIDIMERLNGDTIAYQTVHSHYTHTLHQREPRNSATGVIDKHGYNIYAVELYADSLSFYINGRHTFTYPRIETDKRGQFPFDQPFYLLLDMQLGGEWVGRVEPKDLPVQMYIDWVRFYKRR